MLSDSRVTNNILESDPYRALRFSVNAYFGYKTKGFIGLSAEPGYIKKGFYGWSYNFSTNLNYFNVPLVVDLYVHKKLSFLVGLEPVILMKVSSFSRDTISHRTDLFDKSELSLLTGINYSPCKLFDIGFRYSFAITPNRVLRFVDADGNLIDKMKIYNQYCQLFVRFRFKRKEKK